MKAVLHKACGKQHGWYFGPRESNWPGFVLEQRDYVRMNGSSPTLIEGSTHHAHMFFEECPHCERYIGPMELEFKPPPPKPDEINAMFHVKPEESL